MLLYGCEMLQPGNAVAPPLVVITFDDAHRTVYERAWPVMRSFDSTWAATHFFTVQMIGSPDHTTLNQLREMEAAGWESGGHGISHTNLSALPLDEAVHQIDSSYAFLRNNGLSTHSFAYPYGNYRPELHAYVRQRFSNIRTSHDFHYGNGINRQELGYFAVRDFHTAEDIFARVEQARAGVESLVIIGFHAVISDTSPPIDMGYTREYVYRRFLAFMKKGRYRVLPVHRAMEELDCR